MTISKQWMCKAIGVTLIGSNLIAGCAPQAASPTLPSNAGVAASPAPQAPMQPVSGPQPPPSVAHDIAEQQSSQRPQ